MFAQPASGLCRLSRPRAFELSLSSAKPAPTRRQNAAAPHSASNSLCLLCCFRRPRPAVRGGQRMAISSQSTEAGTEDEAEQQGGGNGGNSGGGSSGGDGAARKAWQQLMRRLSNLPLALGEMAGLAALSAVGTVIEQNKSFAYYIENYPLDNKVLGFVTYDFILTTGLDHIYGTWYFWGLTGLLAASIAACSSTTQLPQLRAAEKVKFLKAPAVRLLPEHSELPAAELADLAALLRSAPFGYDVREDAAGGRLYARKGLVGRAAPLGVHVGLLVTIVGCSVSVLCGWHGSVMVPEGSAFDVAAALKPASALAWAPWGSDARVKVNGFSVEYYPSGAVSQYRSDLSVVGPAPGGAERELDRQTISVNVPLQFGGVTAYQTDWAMSSVTLSVAGQPIRLPMASLEGQPGFNGRIWGTFVPLEAEAKDGRAATERPPGATLLARDFQSVAVYDSAGAFVGVRRPGSGKPIDVAGVPLIVESLSGATGLELKADPGVGLVYLGYAILMPTTFASLLTYSQLWAVQQGRSVLLGGKTTRAEAAFRDEFARLVGRVPEYVDAAGEPPASQ